MTINSLFFLSLFGASYSYFIYPAILVIVGKLFKAKETVSDIKDHVLPSVSFIITAYNEESSIEAKLKNTLLVDYPRDRLEIIVSSDGSSDNTNQIVRTFDAQGVILHEVEERKGKENAQRSAIKTAKGSILVFSDVSTRIEVNAIKIIASQFEDEKIGAISSEDRFLMDDGEVAGEGAYVKYEMWLRKKESHLSGLVGLSGSFFAARKDVCSNWNINIPSDFNTALQCIKHGYKAITVPSLLGFYPNLKDETKEYQRKVRTVIRGMAALFSKAKIMNPFKYGFFAFQVISHKLMRWLVPWFLIIAFVTNLLIFDQSLFSKTIMLGQILFYITAFLGYSSEKARKNTFIKIAYFFVQVNIAIAHSSILYLFGKRVTLWEPSKR